MDFFFVRDHRNRPRFFSAEPLGPLPAHFSKTRAVWEKAKKKVTSLDPRTLLQEQAFEHGGRPGAGPLRILHSGRHDDKSVTDEALLVPPAPSDPSHSRPRRRGRRRPVHRPDRAPARPEHRLLRPGHRHGHPVAGAARHRRGSSASEYELVADPLLAEWEAAVEARDEARYPEILERLEQVHGLPSPRKLLWR